MLTDDQITSFQKLYQEQFGEKISKEEARERGAGLVDLMNVVCRPSSESKKLNQGNLCTKIKAGKISCTTSFSEF